MSILILKSQTRMMSLILVFVLSTYSTQNCWYYFTSPCDMSNIFEDLRWLDLALPNLEEMYLGVIARRIRTMTGESDPSRTKIWIIITKINQSYLSYVIRMWCNSTTDFEDSGLIKSSFIAKDEKLTRTKVKKIK